MKTAYKIDPDSIRSWPMSIPLKDRMPPEVRDALDISVFSRLLSDVDRILQIVNLQFDSAYECWDFDLLYARKNASWEGVLGWRISRRFLPAIPLDLYIYDGESARLCGFPNHTSF